MASDTMKIIMRREIADIIRYRNSIRASLEFYVIHKAPYKAPYEAPYEGHYQAPLSRTCC